MNVLLGRTLSSTYVRSNPGNKQKAESPHLDAALLRHAPSVPGTAGARGAPACNNENERKAFTMSLNKGWCKKLMRNVKDAATSEVGD
jgi:hypothetical protein